MTYANYRITRGLGQRLLWKGLDRTDPTATGDKSEIPLVASTSLECENSALQFYSF